MASGGGSVILVGRPLTTPPKKGSRAQMVADGGSVIWVGRPLTQVGEIAGSEGGGWWACDFWGGDRDQ